MKEKIKKYKPQITIFFVEAVCMILELCSSYLLYPYFGNSNSIWIAIITVILLSNCLGNLLGGRICTKARETRKNYSGTIFFLIAAGISLILGLNEAVIYFVQKLPLSNNVGAFLCSLILFLPCEMLLGTIPPQIMYHESEKKDYNAKKTGLIYALSTMGGLFGTAFGGFVLIPHIGCKYIIILCIAVILVFAFIYEPKFWKKTKNVVCLIVSIGVVFTMATYKQSSNWLNEDYGNIKVDSQYNRIIVQNGYNGKDKVRDMLMASGYESSTYLEKDKRNDLIFEYFKTLDSNVYKDKTITSNNSLMIGGAAYQFPKYLISHYKDKKIDVVEIDETVTELAKKYFFLQDCIDEFDPKGERLKLYNADGRIFLNDAPKYDVILNDAFSGNSPIATLSTTEFIKTVKSKLNKDGIYAINVISSMEGDSKRFLCSECNTLSQQFKNVYIIPASKTNDNGLLNFLVIATDSELQFKDAVNIDYSDGLILTDDYCPVEYLSRK